MPLCSGNFPVSVTVAGLNNSSAFGTAQEVVIAPPPVVAGTSIATAAGVFFQGKVASFTDSTGATASGFTASIAWGDAGNTITTGTVVANSSGGFDVDGSFAYPATGPFTATVTVTRLVDGKKGAGASAVTVSAPQLTLTGTPVTAVAGVAFNSRVASFTDNTGAGASGFTASIAWGDAGNTTTTGTVVANASGGFDVFGTFAYPTPGPFTATVTVTRVATNTKVTAPSSVTVTPAALVATGTTLTPAPVAGTPFTGTVATFTDNTGTTAAGFTASIDWGDANSTTTQGTITPTPSGFTVSGTFTYPSPGLFNPTVTITRVVGNTTAKAVSTANVSPAELTLTGTPVTAVAGVAFNSRVASFTDNTGAGASGFTASIAWGDAGNTTTTGTVVANASGGFDVFGTFAYPTPGPFTATVTVTRVATNTKVTAPSSVTVTPAALVATGTTLTPAPVAGTSFTGTVATFTDNTGTTAAGFTASINWGDANKTTTQGTITPTPGGFAVSGTFNYPTAGLFSPTVLITRVVGGATATATSTANVSSVPFAVMGQVITPAPVAGVPFTSTVASFTDAPGTPASGYTATISWGDSNNTNTTGQVVATSVAGSFTVLGAFTYPSNGSFTATVRVTKVAAGTSASAVSFALVAPTQFTAAGITLEAVAGSPINDALLATFSDSTNTPASGYTASIAWGDAANTKTNGVIVPGSHGGFEVHGSFTYPTAGTFTPIVTITRVVDGKQVVASASVTVNAPLSVNPVQNASATVGTPVSVVLGTVVDRQTGVEDSDYGVSINWGDGTTSMGYVVTVTPPSTTSGNTTTTPGTPYQAVVGNHTYLSATAPSQLYTVSVTLTRIATGQVAPVATVPLTVFPAVTGVVDPLSNPISLNGMIVTDQQQPILSGSAQPLSTIVLTYRRVGGGDPFPLGETQADSTGHWSLVVGPLAGQPIVIYAQALPVNGPPSSPVPLYDGEPVFVTPHPVRVTRAVFGPISGQMTVTVARVNARESDPIGLSQVASYTLIGPDGLSISPTSVRVSAVNPRRPTAPRIVTLTFPPSAVPRRGVSTLRVAFSGVVGTNGTVQLSVRHR